MKPPITSRPVLAVVGLLISCLWHPIVAQDLTLAERSYAYGAKVAQFLKKGNLWRYAAPPEPMRDQGPTLSKAELAVDDFILGFEAALEGDPNIFYQAKQTIDRYPLSGGEKASAAQAQQIAFSNGVLALEGRTQEIKITAAEFDWPALRLGYTDVIKGKKIALQQEQIEAAYAQYHAQWEKRWQTAIIKKALPTTKKDLRQWSYALGAQQALGLKMVVGDQVQSFKVADFIRGAQAMATADLKALLHSNRVKKEAGRHIWEDPELAYHAGRSLLGSTPEVVQTLAPLLDLAALERGFKAMLAGKKVRISKEKRVTICSERHYAISQIEKQLQDRYLQQRKMEPAVPKWSYAPAGSSEEKWNNNPAARRSYALGVWAVQMMQQQNQPQSAMQYEAFVQGMQESTGLDARALQVLTAVLAAYESHQHRPDDPAQIARDCGKFWLGHLLGYLSLGATKVVSDLDKPLFRQGFMEAKMGKALRISEATLAVEVRRYQLLLVERLQNRTPKSAPFQQVTKDYSYTLGFLVAQHYKRADNNISGELALDEVVQGVKAALHGEAVLLQKETLKQMDRHIKVASTTKEMAYYWCLLTIGTRNYDGTVVLTAPLPEAAFEAADFRAGYQDGLKPLPKTRLIQAHLAGLEEAYKAHFERRYFEYLYQQQAERLQNRPDFFQVNAARAGIFTMGNGLQYRILRKGKNQPPPPPNDELILRYCYALTEEAIWTDHWTKCITKLGTTRSKLPQPLQEAIQIMPPGAKYRFYIPYHPSIQLIPAGALPIGTPLVCDLHLMAVKPAPTKR